MNKSDLHIHSCFSDDGELSPEEIIDMAIKAGMDTIAITDHNSVKGIKRAIEYAKDKDINIIPGIEIDCTFNGINLHLLGYNIDFTNECFNKLEEDILAQERAAAIKKIEKIKEVTNLELDANEVLKKSHNGIVTGELIAEVLLENKENIKSPILKSYIEGGNRSDMPFVNFYWDYFSKGKPAYVDIKFIQLKEAIRMIKETNGISVIAHPGNNLKGNLEIIDDLIDEGIDGIEVYSSYHSDEDIKYFFDKAVESNLIITCGTDFHGKNKPNIFIGDFKQKPEKIVDLVV
ncbi:PHP domain-containing protein [Clostridium sardiniense]|uniref:PHP domain-containing protein n=1 Tax=Clostridium sardiniense TaxID=29369 RepID=UPI003D324EBA